MHISWLGSTGIKIQTKPQNDDITVLIDPYKSVSGASPRSLNAHIALFTRGEDESITLSGDPYTLSHGGECEIKGVLLTAVPTEQEQKMIVRIDSESMSVAHLGLNNKIPSNDALENLGNVDILCIAVGGGEGYDPETAIKVINLIEPRVVIPLGFQSENDPNAIPVEKFLKEIGAATTKPEKKVILKKKDLATEDTQIVVLEKE
jgi:L-ascorbate metabolism protein UlaG (beta-lactamase superfamily)